MEIRDIWPDSAVAAGRFKDHGPFYKLARRVEKAVYTQSTVIAAVSEPMSHNISEMRGDSVLVCYNGVSQSEIDRAKERPPKREAPSALTVGYLGNIGHAQALDDLVEAGALIQARQIPDIKLRIIGEVRKGRPSSGKWSDQASILSYPSMAPSQGKRWTAWFTQRSTSSS